MVRDSDRLIFGSIHVDKENSMLLKLLFINRQRIKHPDEK